MLLTIIHGKIPTYILIRKYASVILAPLFQSTNMSFLYKMELSWQQDKIVIFNGVEGEYICYDIMTLLCVNLCHN